MISDPENPPKMYIFKKKIFEKNHDGCGTLNSKSVSYEIFTVLAKRPSRPRYSRSKFRGLHNIKKDYWSIYMVVDAVVERQYVLRRLWPRFFLFRSDIF